jgi:hypothetical protein
MTATYTVQAEGNVDAHQEAKSLFYAEARKAGRAGIVTSTTILSEAQ